MKENDKNTKIENLQNGQEKYGGKNLAYVYSTVLYANDAEKVNEKEKRAETNK